MTVSPRVTILTPALNANKYLAQCIDSVLHQTYANVEHVIVDGGSTDGTMETIERYHVEHPDRVKYASGRDNGVGSALNRAYRLSTGDIFGWIDSDDLYEPHAVARAVEFFQANPDAHFLYGRCNLINAQSEPIGCFVIKDFDFYEWLHNWHYIVFCATFFKRDVIERVGFVNDLGNDLGFYLRVSRKFKLHRVATTFTNWRLHDDSISLKRSPREHQIRMNRVKEDFFLVLRYGGSPFSPRALTYYAVLEPAIARVLRPYVGFARPLLKRIAYQVKLSVSVVQQRHGSYALPLFGNIWGVVKTSLRDLVRRKSNA